MADRQLEDYRLSPAAERDLDEIWRFTAKQWSETQAHRYVADLFRIFAILTRRPEMAAERSEFDPPARMHRHRSHIVIYRAEPPMLIVVRVLHVRRDWRLLTGSSDEG